MTAMPPNEVVACQELGVNDFLLYTAKCTLDVTNGVALLLAQQTSEIYK